jgi:hypothetical protein
MLNTVALTPARPRFEIIEPERFRPSTSLLLIQARYWIGSRVKFICLRNPTRVNRSDRYLPRPESDCIAEIFLSNHRSGSQADANARDAAIAASLAFQHGCPLEALRGALLRDMQGRPATPLGVALDIAAEQGTGSAP